MGWARLDDHWHDNPKMLRLSLEAVGLDSRGITWASSNLSDGYLELSVVKHLAGVRSWKKIADSLVEAGRWELDPETGGYWIHDFLEYNPSKQEVLAKRKAAAERVAKHRHSRSGDESNADVTRYSRVSNADVTPLVTPPHPIPSHIVTEVTSFDCSGARDPEPNPAAKAAPKRTRRKSQTEFPEGFTLTDDMRAWPSALSAVEAGVSLEAEFEKFKNYHIAKGNTFADWRAAFRTWLANAVEFSRRRGNQRVEPPSRFDELRAIWEAEEAKEQVVEAKVVEVGSKGGVNELG